MRRPTRCHFVLVLQKYRWHSAGDRDMVRSSQSKRSHARLQQDAKLSAGPQHTAAKVQKQDAAAHDAHAAGHQASQAEASTQHATPSQSVDEAGINFIADDNGTEAGSDDDNVESLCGDPHDEGPLSADDEELEGAPGQDLDEGWSGEHVDLESDQENSDAGGAGESDGVEQVELDEAQAEQVEEEEVEAEDDGDAGDHNESGDEDQGEDELDEEDALEDEHDDDEVAGLYYDADLYDDDYDDHWGEPHPNMGEPYINEWGYEPLEAYIDRVSGRDRVARDRAAGQAGRCWAEQDLGACTNLHCRYRHSAPCGGAAAAL